MKNMFRYLAYCICLSSISNINADSFVPRSTGVDTARELAGSVGQINRTDVETMYGMFGVALGGGRSFRDNSIAYCLFGNDIFTCGDFPALRITGSRITNRSRHDWLADYFGLPTDYESIVLMQPEIKNFFTDFQFYLGLNDWVQGLFFRFSAPVVRTTWDLNLCEIKLSCTSGIADYEPGYFTPSTVPNSNLSKSFINFISNGVTPNLGDNVTFYSLCNCRLNQCPTTETALADIRAILGWNFLRNERYHLGLGILVAAPTGNTPSHEYMFSPIIGNGHHWELGMQWTSHYDFYHAEDDDTQVGLYVDMNVSHLFNDTQTRCFDLCGKPNSRYMLAQKITATTALDSSINPGVGFSNAYTSVANLTSRCVDVSYPVQVDLSIMLHYGCCTCSWDVGYNLWYRSGEKYSKTACSAILDGTTWALKGDAAVYGFAGGSGAPINLAATESEATINAGTNNFTGPNGFDGGLQGIPPIANPGIDNRAVAITATNGVFATLALTTSTHTSNKPIFLTDCNINLKSEALKGITQKFFTCIRYTWIDRTTWTPFICLGAEIELGTHFDPNDNCAALNNCCKDLTFCKKDGCPKKNAYLCDNACDLSCIPEINCGLDCQKTCGCGPTECSLSQWSVWVKGGVSFD